MRKYSMKSMKRKNHQRWLNQYFRYINKCIEDDDLWLGRFCIKQLSTQMEWFEDKSGGLIHVKLIMWDKKKGIVRVKWYNGLDMDWKFWRDFNDFIINDCKVWEEVPDPRENRIDFRRIK